MTVVTLLPPIAESPSRSAITASRTDGDILHRFFKFFILDMKYEDRYCQWHNKEDVKIVNSLTVADTQQSVCICLYDGTS